MQMYSCLCGRYILCSRICDYMYACVAETACSLPPSLPPSHTQACLRGLLCTRCGPLQAALEPLSGSASTLPAWAVLCYAVLCLLSLARNGGWGGGSVLSLMTVIFGGSIKTLAGS